jgi:hypothetical protein
VSEVSERRDIRRVSEREIAIALVMEFAEGEWHDFSMMGFYDDDADFISTVAERLQVQNNRAFTNKMTRVVRRLVRYNVLHGLMMSTQKDYFGEPAKQKNYWLRPGKAVLIRHEPGDHWMGAMGETEFLLRYAYPAPPQSTDDQTHE